MSIGFHLTNVFHLYLPEKVASKGPYGGEGCRPVVIQVFQTKETAGGD